MYRYGHYGAALLAYAPIAFAVAALGFETLVFVGALATLALTTVPDYDQRIPTVTHRGPTHTVWFAAVVGSVGLLVGVVVGARWSVPAAVGLGSFGFVVAASSIFAHIAADALTPAGVRPFAPWNGRRYTYDIVTAANPIANYALLSLGLLAVLSAFGAGTALADAATGV
ncbi:metal-dependent hydrolase [Halarchaeum nitratireducens]|uniref:Metal-dependent hydrolase n=1 Tax=Halarchaeum nitratireducens TaxID=489913 RepID=A0A830GF27_9EURY|nr:metal-dependent hydrolase [Halarchaeum nitratireducens]MBP2251046.1 inner membrane protein [Halarchaeum solikamskense]GGN21882.1 hypothetical protein GCM10009021_24090 [Halarchaeum nitratireducens]